MFYFRTTRGRVVAFAMAIIMAFTIYGGLGTASVLALTDQGQPAKAQNALEIQNVEVLTSPELQAAYRPQIHQGLEEHSEDPEKWYTTDTTINLRDPRAFTFVFSVDAATVGDDPEAFLEKVDLEYGGHNLKEWANNPNARGSANTLRDEGQEGAVPYLVLDQDSKSIKENLGGGYNVTLTMETRNAWAPRNTKLTNVPYENYGGGRQLYQFSDGQSADNRWWWQTTPTHKGLGEYDMTAVADGKVLASTKMDIQQYDDGNSWIQMNEFAQSLVFALTGTEVPKEAIAEQITGLVASGYIGVDENGNFVPGDRSENVYIEVSILGYGLTDNEKKENRDFNNYARYNPIWNVVVAQDESKIDTYLNETKPAMNEDPDKLINKYKDADPEDIDMINVYYQNNVHSDEVTGSDSEIKLIRDLIIGGKEGQTIDYYSWTDDDIEFRYRDPSDGYEQSEVGHVVKDGYDGRFKDKDARQKMTFDTKEALDKFIFVNTICSNPDGKAGMRRTNRYAFDLNRDAVFTTMPETIALIRDIMKWDPLLLNEWHGYVQQMLIEPCTAPHDPAYDYDLLANNMQNLMYAAGEAITANTGYDNFLNPWDHYDAGDWDDGGTIYSPMFAELLGTFGYTIEFPDSNSDSMNANNVIHYAMINELLHGTCDFYPGNRLNGPLKDVTGELREGHEGDIIDTSMRKNSILSKLETKKRGIENVDSMDADKYFIDKKTLPGETQVQDLIVGRARPVDQAGETLPFFPDYVVIPYGDAQYNFAEGIKGINQMINWGIKVDVTTEDVTYDDPITGKSVNIPAGSYVMNMKQANRNVIFEVMSKGYDATGFDSMYADIYCNLPDVRGFDSIQVYGEGLFDGKTDPQEVPINKTANISGDPGAYVTFKSQSTDAVRFVNHLLKNKADVWMMTETVEGVAVASDYVIQTDDLSLLKTMEDNPVIGIEGCEIEGQYLSSLPEKTQKLVDPVIQFNTARTAQTGGTLWYLLDDYLQFNSLADYNGGSALRKDANVIIANNVNKNNFQDSWVDAIKDGAGVIFIRNAAGLEKLGQKAPTTAGTFQDVALNGTYNIDETLFSANYAKTDTYYARGYYYSNLPDNAKVIFKTLAKGEDAFIGGFQPTQGKKDVFGDKTTIFSTTLAGSDFVQPVNALVIGQQMDYRSHYQKLLPMLATAIYAGAAGITDYPVIEEPVELFDNNYGVTASSTTSDIVSITVKKDGKVFAEGVRAAYFTLRSAQPVTLQVEAVDMEGNKTVRDITIEPEPSDVMKKAARQVIKANESLAAGDYTPESVAELQAKIAALTELLNAEATTFEEMDEIDEAIQIAEAELLAAWIKLTPAGKDAEAAAAKGAATDNLLRTLIKVYDLDYELYTLDSLINLAGAVANAEGTLAKEDVTAAELRTANTVLLTAWKDLKLDDIAIELAARDEAAAAALTTLIAANNLDPGIYTEDSYKVLANAASELNALLDNEEATADQLKEATTTLMRAMSLLKRVESVPPAVAQKERATDDLLKTMIGVNAVDTTIYKDASVADLMAVMDQCELLLADETATAKALMDANTALLKSWKSLAKKDANPMTAKAKKVKKVSAKTLKKKSKTIKNVISVSDAQGKVTYAKVSGNKKITVKSSNGSITLKKGLKKGSYKVKVAVKAAGNSEFLPIEKNVTLKVTIKE